MRAIHVIGERAVVRRFDAADLLDTSRVVRALHRFVTSARFEEVEDVISGADSLTVILRGGYEPTDALMRALDADPAPQPVEPRAHTIEVRYDGADLLDINGVPAEQVVALHTGATYTVAFVGFAPGFAYLLGLPSTLHVPRLSEPRARVPAGSVGIAGPFTGVYPHEGPGGWRLLGTTDAPLFDARRDPPNVLAAGDRVRFVAR